MSAFLDVPEGEWVAANALAFAIRDRFAVSRGHTLVITRRVTPTWWEATAEEQAAIFDLVGEVKRDLDHSHRPEGYNVGFNSGEVAGQTVHHLHVHVIPRYAGDVADPRGGIRHVIPGKGNYLAPAAEPDSVPSGGGLSGVMPGVAQLPAVMPVAEVVSVSRVVSSSASELSVR